MATHPIASRLCEISMSEREPGHWCWKSSFGWHDCSPKEDEEILRGLPQDAQEEVVRMSVASPGSFRLTQRRCAHLSLDIAVQYEDRGEMGLRDRYFRWALELEP